MKRTTAGVRDAVIYRELIDRFGIGEAFIWYITHQMDDARGLIPLYKPQLTIGGKSVPCERIEQIKEQGFASVDMAAGVSFSSMLIGVIDIGLEYDNLPKFVPNEWASPLKVIEPKAFFIDQPTIDEINRHVITGAGSDSFDFEKFNTVKVELEPELCDECDEPLDDDYEDLTLQIGQNWCRKCCDRMAREYWLSMEILQKERELRAMQTHLTIASGKKTYQARDALKSAGFLWNPETRRWEKCPPLDEGDRRAFVNVLRRLDVADGVTVETIRKPEDGEGT